MTHKWQYHKRKFQKNFSCKVTTIDSYQGLHHAPRGPTPPLPPTPHTTAAHAASEVLLRSVPRLNITNAYSVSSNRNRRTSPLLDGSHLTTTCPAHPQQHPLSIPPLPPLSGHSEPTSSSDVWWFIVLNSIQKIRHPHSPFPTTPHTAEPTLFGTPHHNSLKTHQTNNVTTGHKNTTNPAERGNRLNH